MGHISHLRNNKLEKKVMNIKAGYQVVKSCYDFLKKTGLAFYLSKIESSLPMDALCQI